MLGREGHSVVGSKHGRGGIRTRIDIRDGMVQVNGRKLDASVDMVWRKRKRNGRRPTRRRPGTRPHTRTPTASDLTRRRRRRSRRSLPYPRLSSYSLQLLTLDTLDEKASDLIGTLAFLFLDGETRARGFLFFCAAGFVGFVFGVVGAVDVAGVFLCVLGFFVFGLDFPGRFLVFGKGMPALRYKSHKSRSGQIGLSDGVGIRTNDPGEGILRGLNAIGDVLPPDEVRPEEHERIRRPRDIVRILLVLSAAFLSGRRWRVGDDGEEVTWCRRRGERWELWRDGVREGRGRDVLGEGEGGGRRCRGEHINGS